MYRTLTLSYLFHFVFDFRALLVEQRPRENSLHVGLVRLYEVIQGLGRVEVLLQHTPRGLQNLEHHVVAAARNKPREQPRIQR